MDWRTHDGGVRALMDATLRPDAIALAWLGQAGFAIRHGGRLVLIDPYLSDSLAEKYRGTEFPHIRMSPAPVRPDALRGVDAVFCTHRHSDHMDPGALPAIAAHNPECLFVVPRAERDAAARIGLPEERLVTIDAGQACPVADGIRVRAVASAHETLETNDRGEHRFLGYLLHLGGATLYHSGDCVPYDGLDEHLRQARIALALLPVNGRDEYRRLRGIPGNMTFDEAVALCRATGIPRLVPHHFGMFDFNTCDVRQLMERIAAAGPDVQVILPHLDVWFELLRGNQ